jgi:hypothetical protein
MPGLAHINVQASIELNNRNLSLYIHPILVGVRQPYGYQQTLHK